MIKTENAELYQVWLAEESCARIHGWDFSHIEDRYEEEPLSWSYKEEIQKRLSPTARLLDTDTGGGEFLRALAHPTSLTAATENYPPNVALCRETLLPLGVDFRAADAGRALPFADNTFDMVLSRHGAYCAEELFRVLSPGGVFLTQQVGCDNDRALVELLLPGTPKPFPEQTPERMRQKFKGAGFQVTELREEFPEIRFYDVGALVWFARIIEWEFPGFSVDACAERLLCAQKILVRDGVIRARTHRIFMAAEVRADGQY